MTFKLKQPPIYDFYSEEAPIAWDKMVGESKPALVILKASQYKWKDSKTAEFVSECKQRGLKYGLYHFLHENDIEAQAKTYIEVVKSVGGLGNCLPIVDVEIEPKNNGKDWAGQIKTFLDLVEAEFGIKGMIYTSVPYWKFTFSRNVKLQLVPPAWTKDYYLWTAGYPYSQYIDQNNTIPKTYIPAGWEKAALWQYNDKGRANGFLANDLNIGDEWFLRELESLEPIIIDETPDVEEPNIELTGAKYKVNTSVLNLRPDPSTSNAALKKLSIGTIVEEISKNENSSWIKVKEPTGVIGWCSAVYLTKISEAVVIPPDGEDGGGQSEETILEELCGKAVYSKHKKQTPHGEITYHLLKVKREDATVFITPSPRSSTYVPDFLKRNKLQVAINGDGFHSVRKGRNWNLVMAGLSSSNGQPYGTAGTEGAIFIDKLGFASFTRPAGKDLWNAIAFPNKLVEDGTKAKISRKDVDPRTALGFTKDSDIIILTVDGKETYNMYRTGATFDELAEILLENGAWIGVNMDGGGSTTLVVEGDGGTPVILNEPCGENNYSLRGKTYKLRPVANHFGLKIS